MTRRLPTWKLPIPGVCGHRGARGEGPENTLYAMSRALSAGATHLEVDVRRTADDVPVCHHDETADRTCLDPATIEEIDAQQVRELDPCALWSELAGIATGEREPPGGVPRRWFQVPTLSDVVSTFPGVPLIVDLKKTAPPDSVANVLRSWNRTSDVLLAGYDDEVLEATAEQVPEVSRGCGLEGTRTFFEGGEPPGDVVVVPRTYQGIDLVDAEFVEQAHKQGRGFWVWTINEERSARELFEMDVDGIITDVPTKMARLRAARLRGDL